ncbi:HD domain-containing protein [Streptomyces sp. NBC_01335]|uniref:HD domain-containing protein n=1 Tax=Streptomyces sp. NBC_01335 TaxID=2903828 RepID=UPI003FA36B49
MVVGGQCYLCVHAEARRRGAPGDRVLDVRLRGKEHGLPRPTPLMCHLDDTAAVFQELWDVVLGEGTNGAISAALGLSSPRERR